jgi:hypothetical protein
VEGAAGTLVVFLECEALDTWRLAAGTLDRDPSSALTKASADALLVVVVENGASGAADREPELPGVDAAGLDPPSADSFGAG